MSCTIDFNSPNIKTEFDKMVVSEGGARKALEVMLNNADNSIFTATERKARENAVFSEVIQRITKENDGYITDILREVEVDNESAGLQRALADVKQWAIDTVESASAEYQSTGKVEAAQKAAG